MSDELAVAPSITSPAADLPDPLPHILTTQSLNLLAGASGVGKTSLIAWMATCFRDGSPIFGHASAAPPAIGYIAADRPWRDAALWFSAVGFPDIAHYSVVDDRAFVTSRLAHAKPGIHAELFAETLDHLSCPPGSVVFVDPIAIFLGGDLNHYIRVAVGCINLYRVIQDRQLCVVGIVHSGKQKGDAKERYARLQDRISGSMAQLGYSATQMYLAGPEEMGTDYHTFYMNPHHAPPQTCYLKQSPTTGLFDVFDPHHQIVVGMPDPGLPDYLQTLLVLIPTWPETISTATLVQQYVDSSRRTLFRYLRELEERKLIAQVRKGLWTRGYDNGPRDPLPDPPQDS